MDFAKLEADGYVTSTGKGKRVSINVRVYPEGFGQIIVRREKGQVQPVELMCNNVEEAVAYLREIWKGLSAVEGKEEQP
jgi:hypothetical protein